MRHLNDNPLVVLVGGFLIGFVSWGHTVLLTPISLLLPLLYFYTEKRVLFFLLALGYYLGASRGLFWGTAVFYEKYLYAASIYTGAALIVAAAWVIFWGRSMKQKIFYFLITQVLLAVSPVALISWANPMQSAGILFPGWGFFGLLALFFLIGFTVYGRRYTKEKVALLSFLVFSLSTYNYLYVDVSKGETVEEVRSNLLYATGEMDPLLEFERQRKFLKIANESSKPYVLLPESSVGFVSPAQRMIWSRLDDGKTVLAGGHQVSKHNPKEYYNVLYEITDTSTTPIYFQRVPVPISMWKFWSDEGAYAALLDNPVIKYDGERTAVLICYEQLIVPTYLHSLIEKPKKILAVSNLWWARGTTILNIQKQTMVLWSMLFDVPVYFSYNE